jgi:hypothetical protein
VKKRLLIAVVWIAFGIHNWGATLGYFVGQFPGTSHRDHYGIAGITAVAGPVWFPVALFGSNLYQYGFVWK